MCFQQRTQGRERSKRSLQSVYQCAHVSPHSLVEHWMDPDIDRYRDSGAIYSQSTKQHIYDTRTVRLFLRSKK